MSEYQYYEFAAVDRPLDPDELAAVRSLSTRADITPSSFVNEYHWGDFRGDPQVLVEEYYDAFLHLANWGTRWLMLRFPAALLDISVAQSYCAGDAVTAWSAGEHVIVSVTSEDEEGDDVDWDAQGVLASILPVRAEVLAGDLRALYLMWLAGVGPGLFEEDAVEPPVPAGLATLTGSQTALARFLRVDGDLLAVAAAASAPAQVAVGPDIEGWVAGLASVERDALLVGLLRGADPHLRVTTLRRIGTPTVDDTPRRTAGHLLDAATDRREGREREERERHEREAAESARLAAEKRRAHLDALAAEGERAWERVATRIAEKRPVAYDIAVALLLDLQEVTGEAEFDRRIEGLKVEYRRRPGLLDRMATAGL